MPYSNHPLAPELPFLRRYARAATGQRDMGDTIIANVMADLAEATTDTNSPYPRRVRQFRVLVSAINTTLAPNATQAASVGANVAALPSTMRHALLLTALEDFQPKDAASILNVSTAEIPTLITSAQESLRHLSSKRILVIEDDDLLAAAITGIIQKMGHKVCAHARTEQEALAAVAAETPALILADVHLGPGGSGLSAVQQIMTNSTIPVIFVTGYPELVLTGKGIEPAFVIRKPYREEALQTAITQALATGHTAHN